MAKVWLGITWGGPDTQLIGPFGDDKLAAIKSVVHDIKQGRAEQGGVVELDLEDVSELASE